VGRFLPHVASQILRSAQNGHPKVIYQKSQYVLFLLLEDTITGNKKQLPKHPCLDNQQKGRFIHLHQKNSLLTKRVLKRTIKKAGTLSM
jgi:hypothetical protein